jgi:hypothetical protein
MESVPLGGASMKERPILFSAEMVRAILEGRKTQTRRVIKPQPDLLWNVMPDGRSCRGDHHRSHDCEWEQLRCPYGVPGDRLWVRESFRMGKAPNCPQGIAWVGGTEEHSRVIPHPDAPANAMHMALRWEKKPSIHMPRWASRITLEIVDIRVQQLQEIGEEDAAVEGVRAWSTPMPNSGHVYIPEFINLWNKINAKRGFGWDTNPWVWAITFKRV